MSVPHSAIRTGAARECHTPGMSRTTGGAGPRHEQAHDPARADWHGWSAEHPEPEPFGQVVDRTDLAPFASTGGHSAYSFEGRAIQSANLGRALLADNRWGVRIAGWLFLLGLVGITAGIGIWHLVELI